MGPVGAETGHGDGELIAQVYRSLVHGTLLPSDPLVVGQAALAALAGEAGEDGDARPPGWFGQDLERDAAWLANRLAPAKSPWPVLVAMARAADKPHTGVVHESVMAGVIAVSSGLPRTFPGLGMWRQPDGAGLVVARVDTGGSAEASGLRLGDLVVAIDDRPPSASGLHVVPILGAPPGSSMALQVERAGKRHAIDLALEPGPVVSLTTRVLQGRVGYIGIPWFASSDDASVDTAVLVRAALTEFLEVHATRGVVIDLRSGMGGSLTAVRGILSAMTEADDVVAVSPLEGEPVAYPRQGECMWPGLPIAVLVNEQTTSAAEALALGLQELAGAALVGAPSSGGLNTLKRVDLRDGYSLVLPDQVMLGPKSLAARPGYRLEPAPLVPNPTAGDVAVGIDAQLEAARVVPLH